METTIETKEDIKQQDVKKKKKKIGIIIAVSILVVLSIIYAVSPKANNGNSENTKKALNGWDYYSPTLQCLRPYFQFQETVKLSTYNYTYQEFDDYVLWRTNGTVEAENAYSVKIKHKYIVYIKVVGEQMYKDEVWIDDECVYKSETTSQD